MAFVQRITAPAYFNEFDPGAAAWLRELMRTGLIPDGEVDERSILDVSADERRAVDLQEAFSTNYFRPYTNTDVIGCELGGAVKNVIALACGMAAGVGLGQNTLATIITRGLAETIRLGVAAGADAVVLPDELCHVGSLRVAAAGGEEREDCDGKDHSITSHRAIIRN